MVVVEHDLDVIRTADWVIEMGPGAGWLGSTILAEGTPAALEKNKKSIIGPYLAGRATVERPRRPSTNGRAAITVSSLYNLRDATAAFTVGRLTAFADPSGAGKIALVLESLPAARAQLAGEPLPDHVAKLALGSVRQVVEIDATRRGGQGRRAGLRGRSRATGRGSPERRCIAAACCRSAQAVVSCWSESINALACRRRGGSRVCRRSR
ncbi:hypothetical protein [Amycolatopsis sp. FDAARGOS 1241]|uniref:hypothetical protein n=1 Tax=Amycolatopsis sp. FDAARGOS 1241 TaxID=2778070 RepID=UPI00194F213A|nr:hypothetical protein [Amycolatopsis sp. FDAARGOS 1241]QRP47051.1 hypothetical protein I6J71_03210 [Amycolatopsis sp. FDAARGOS 1241]